MTETVTGFTHSLTITAPCVAVIDAFFSPEQLGKWWGVRRSLCVPRTFGCYAVEWPPTDWADEVLGRLGGVFHGTVISHQPDREIFIADAYWLPPDGDPIGPMALEISCTSSAHGTILHVRQSGCDDSPRWQRYYNVMGTGFMLALEQMKTTLENRWRP